MDFYKVDKEEEIAGRVKFANTKITKKNYSGSAHKSANQEEWSITNILQTYSNCMTATFVASHVSGDDSKGKRKSGVPILSGINVTLKVLTRQACFTDDEGNRININPLSDNFVCFDEAPKDGDVIRVNRGSLTSNPETEEQYTQAELVQRRLYEEPMFEYEDVVVENGTITVDGFDAMSLLCTKGHRLVAPKFNRVHTKIKDNDNKSHRKITNWHFEEVAEPKKTNKPKSKSLPKD